MSQAQKIRAMLVERLRTTGTLSASERPVHAISAIEAKDPVALTVARMINSKSNSSGTRWLAPAVNHSVLP